MKQFRNFIQCLRKFIMMVTRQINHVIKLFKSEKFQFWLSKINTVLFIYLTVYVIVSSRPTLYKIFYWFLDIRQHIPNVFMLFLLFYVLSKFWKIIVLIFLVFNDKKGV